MKTTEHYAPLVGEPEPTEDTYTVVMVRYGSPMWMPGPCETDRQAALDALGHYMNVTEARIFTLRLPRRMEPA